MYGYIYKTTCLINNKIYIGQHKCCEFDEKYYGSGTSLNNAIQKYGKSNFIVELLEWCDTLTELNTREIEYIKLYNSTNKKIGYNITLGGNQISIVPEIAQKISISQQNNFNDSIKGPKLRKRLSEVHKGKKISKEHIEKLKEVNHIRIRTKEERDKLSKSLLGHKGCIHKQEYLKELSKRSKRSHWFNNGIVEVFKENCPNGFKRGRLPFSNSWKQNIGKAQLNRIITEETRKKLSLSKLGNKATFGKIVINKNNKNKFIPRSELEEYLKNGWLLGGKKKIK